MKKRNTKQKNRFIITIFLIITISIIVLSNINNLKIKFLSLLTGYPEKTINTLLEEEIYNDIKTYKYSKTLDKIINTDYYQKEHLIEYLNINYIDEENFLQDINLLLNKGYNNKNINKIYEILSINSIQILIQEDYIKDINNIITLSYFKEDKIKRYISYYQNTNTKDIETIVTHVNIGLDNNYYTNIENIDNQDNIDVLVNKYHSLDETYIPNDLVTINKLYGHGQLKKRATEAFEKMASTAKEENIDLISGSAYRSYSYQKNLYNYYVSIDGRKTADTYSARPGHSEHQTGLALDLVTKNGSFIQDSGKEFTWLKNNAHKFGFILRYPKEKEEITGYMYEPWHYRYVGIDIATEIYNLNITYDEYVAKK